MTDLAALKRASDWFHETDEQDMNCEGLDDYLPISLCFTLSPCDIYSESDPDGFGRGGQEAEFIGAIIDGTRAMSAAEFHAAYPAANFAMIEETVFEEINNG